VKPKFILEAADALLKLIRYFNERGLDCYMFQETLKDRLKCSLRALQAAIAHLKQLHRLKVIHRGPTSSIYRLLEEVPDTQISFAFEECGPFCEAPTLLYELKPESKEKPGRVFVMPRPQENPPMSEYKIPLGYEEPVVRMITIAVKAGKPFGHRDATRTAAALRARPFEEWEKIVSGYERMCLETAETRFIPWPASYINSEAWDRVTAPRSLPMPAPAGKGIGYTKQRHDAALEIARRLQREA
jgi:hypothetical protein